MMGVLGACDSETGNTFVASEAGASGVAGFAGLMTMVTLPDDMRE
jgi:hypothetical protein